MFRGEFAKDTLTNTDSGDKQRIQLCVIGKAEKYDSGDAHDFRAVAAHVLRHRLIVSGTTAEAVLTAAISATPAPP